MKVTKQLLRELIDDTYNDTFNYFYGTFKTTVVISLKRSNNRGFLLLHFVRWSLNYNRLFHSIGS